jgi:hypothetical protein
MKDLFLIERSKFMAAAGIKTRSRFMQVLKGFKQKKNGKEYFIDPLLLEGKDYKYERCRECGRETVYFTQNALEKILESKKAAR